MTCAIDLSTHKSIRLAVSGDVALNRLETALLDTADFQRLRQVRQLGPCCLVYPTALHSRFDHSLGTLSMACRMLEAIAPQEGLSITPEQIQLARLFALLHDITHIPFGHTLEDEFCIFARHDSNSRRIERFLGADSPVGSRIVKALGADLHDRLIRLFQGGSAVLPEDGFILDLVTNTICADLLDYLRRDAFFCNISMDSDYRFLRHLALVPHKGRTRLAIRLWKDGTATPRRDVLNELIRLLDNRYLLGERVYFHHAKLVAGTMIAAAVARAKAAGELAEEDLYELGDDTLVHRLRTQGNPASRRLMDCIANRTLWKRIYERTRMSLLAEQQSLRTVNIMQDLMKRFHRHPSRRTQTEDRIAALLGLGVGDLLIYCPDQHMAMKTAECMVFWNGELRPLKDCTDDELSGGKMKSILDSHQNLWTLRVFASPARLDAAETMAEAVEGLLTYEPTKKKRLLRSFYADLIRKALALRSMTDPKTQEERVKKTVEKILRMDEEARTSEAIDNLLENA